MFISSLTADTVNWLSGHIIIMSSTEILMYQLAAEISKLAEDQRRLRTEQYQMGAMLKDGDPGEGPSKPTVRPLIKCPCHRDFRIVSCRDGRCRLIALTPCCLPNWIAGLDRALRHVTPSHWASRHHLSYPCIPPSSLTDPVVPLRTPGCLHSH